MDPTTTRPTVGAYAPPSAAPTPASTADADLPSAADVGATVRVVRWLWQKHVFSIAAAALVGYRAHLGAAPTAPAAPDDPAQIRAALTAIARSLCAMQTPEQRQLGGLPCNILLNGGAFPLTPNTGAAPSHLSQTAAGEVR